ncbi:SDR family NAD(P)-dependent oxidoreductase [Actinomycetospora chlora]|uniref:SDR family NAD(P)-dependent oxidoreductase n=1 Tax=Actinomycetospora chlora TaxID=663608 RepID=UPI0031EEB532
MSDPPPRALVTGASSGIGAALARELATRGHPLVLVARRGDALERLAAELPTPTDVVVADLATEEGLRTVEDLITDTADPVRLLVNNAATGAFARLTEQDAATLDATVHVNVLAPLRLSRAALRRMDGRGGIMMISSPVAVGTVGLTAYAASKAFLDALGRGLVAEAPAGVRITTVAPGYTRTEFHDRLGEDVSGIPDRWWLTPEDVARTALDAHARGEQRVEPGRPSTAQRAVQKARRLTRPVTARLRRRGTSGSA